MAVNTQTVAELKGLIDCIRKVERWARQENEAGVANALDSAGTALTDYLTRLSRTNQGA